MNPRIKPNYSKMLADARERKDWTAYQKVLELARRYEDWNWATLAVRGWARRCVRLAGYSCNHWAKAAGLDLNTLVGRGVRHMLEHWMHNSESIPIVPWLRCKAAEDYVAVGVRTIGVCSREHGTLQVEVFNTFAVQAACVAQVLQLTIGDEVLVGRNFPPLSEPSLH